MENCLPYYIKNFVCSNIVRPFFRKKSALYVYVINKRNTFFCMNYFSELFFFSYISIPFYATSTSHITKSGRTWHFPINFIYLIVSFSFFRPLTFRERLNVSLICYTNILFLLRLRVVYFNVGTQTSSYHERNTIQIWSRSFPAWISVRSRLSFMCFVICTPSEFIQPLMESWITFLSWTVSHHQLKRKIP